ncbi:PAPA-1-like conserved region [Penicillium sp. IBT 35674x]|nr:PAPA-1-like conserved region [Penicillium sp. IBT 35674x]
MPAGKLREATGGRSGRRSVNVFQENPIVSGPRTSRNKKKLVEIATSDDEIEDQEEDEVDDEDAPGEDDEDADADGDLDMDDAPPQPPVRRSAKQATTTRGKTTKSVEEKEMEMEEDEEEEEEEEDENVSDTDSDAEGEPDDQDESAVPDINVDDLDEEDEEDELDDDMDSDALAMEGKQTKRQRGNLGNDFLQLPMEPQVKKHLTAEERAMRRAEMARRRKNLSEKRNEEEKMDTINRLLRKQPPKRRGRAAAEGAESTPADGEAPEAEKADPIMVRWISNADGCKIGVPEEWLGTSAGRLFGAPVANGNGKLVEEV